MGNYGDRNYRDKRAALLRQTRKNNLPCHICGHPFDWTITDRKHPMHFEADHATPLARGGKLLGELRPSHKSCNGRRSAKPLNDESRAKPKTTRDW